MMERKVTYTPCFEDILFALGMINRNLEAIYLSVKSNLTINLRFAPTNRDEIENVNL